VCKYSTTQRCGGSKGFDGGDPLGKRTSTRGSKSARAPFPDFENTVDLDRELATYVAKSVPPMARHQDGESVVHRYREENAYRTGKHAAFVADFVTRYEAAQAREAEELPLIKLHCDFVRWRRKSNLPEWSPIDLQLGQIERGTALVRRVKLNAVQQRIVEDFGTLLMRAAIREGYLFGRRPVWLIGIASPWTGDGQLCWRLPLPDRRAYRSGARVPAEEFLEMSWVIEQPFLRQQWLVDQPKRIVDWLAGLGITATLVVEPAPPKPAKPRVPFRANNVVPLRRP